MGGIIAKATETVKVLEPIMVCTVYAGNTSFLEVREVTNNGLSYTLGAAKPMSRKATNKLREILGEPERTVKLTRGILSDKILYAPSYAGDDLIIWYRLPKLARIKILGFKPEEFTVRLPGLIFQVSNGYLKVYAFKGKVRPKADTPLFHLSFKNTNSKGGVCMGNNHVRNASTITEFSEEMEQLFFDSRFTTSGGADDIWRKVQKTGIFPETELQDMKIKLKDLL